MLRELIGSGTLFRDLGTLIPGAGNAGIVIADGGLLIALLPPGAFFALALILIARNLVSNRAPAGDTRSADEPG